MKRFFRKFLRWSLIGIGILLILLITAAALFEKPISRQIIKQLNKQLTTELQVQDSRLSLVRHFPNASAELKGVRLAGALDDELLTAETLAFRFSLFSLLSSNIQVKSILLKDGKLIIVQSNHQGRSNYDIFKSTAETDTLGADNQNISLSIDKALLENMALGYVDIKGGHQMRLFVKNAEIGGDFSATRYNLQSKAELFCKYIEQDETRYAVNKNMNYRANIDVDIAAGTYQMKDVQWQIENTPFEIKGDIEDKGNQVYDIDLSLSSQEGNIGDIFGLFPSSTFQKLQGLESEGNYFANATVKGRYQPNGIMPAIQAEFGIEDGRIRTRILRKPFKDVSFKASYSNGEAHNKSTSSFKLDNFRGYFDKELLDLQLHVENFEVPYVSLQMDGVLAGEAIASLLNRPYITGGRGELEFHDIDIQGRYADMLRTTRAEGVRTRGRIEFDDLALDMNQRTLRFDRGDMLFQGNTYQVKELHLEGPDTDIEFEGKVENLLPVLLADSINSEQATLAFSGLLTADEIDFDELMALSKMPESETRHLDSVTLDSVHHSEIARRNRIVSFLNGEFEARVRHFNYRKIEGRNFLGKLQFQHSQLTFEGHSEAMGGRFSIDGKGYFSNAPQLVLNVVTEEVDVNEFFYQNENLYQEVLVADNIGGIMDAKIGVEAFWSPEGKFLMNDLRVLADVNIQEGELKDFEMLYEYAKYVDIDELKHIKFSQLQNWLEIKNQTLFIPVMFIQTSAMNLTLSGEHTFDHDMDYYFKINAGQILAQKFKRKDRNFDPVPAKRKGWLNLYVHLFGNLEKYEYNTKSKVVKAYFNKTDRRKEYIQQQLIRRFGPIINLDEPVSWKDDIPEYQEESNSEEPTFLEGFD